MLRKTKLTFPFALEVLVWIFYVAFYKYSHLLEQTSLPVQRHLDFPYPSICLYGIICTLFMIPYYRWMVPKLLDTKKYTLLFVGTIAYVIILATIFNMLMAGVFEFFTKGMVVESFYTYRFRYIRMDWDLLLTDLVAFLCISFSRHSFESEKLRHKIETDHLKLQLGFLKAQLQPHFLFNTLNSLYGMSLTGSRDTSRFILLLSQMMQYILYDCNQEEVGLSEEVNFLKGYFEIEQKKFPEATITFEVPESLPSIKVPPLLFLPLVENSFKHGKHRLTNEAGVYAKLAVNNSEIVFEIKNEILPEKNGLGLVKGGIGLVNIKKRLELYYPKRNDLTLLEVDGYYSAHLRIKK